MAERPVRILHCPDNVAGNAAGLARAEREIGLDSWSAALRSHRFGFQPDEIVFNPGDGMLRRASKRWALIWRAIRDYDIIHFNFGQSILRSRRDLPLIRASGKVIAVTYQGSDARQGDVCRELFQFSPYEDEEFFQVTKRKNKKNRKYIAAFDRHADCIFALNPDLMKVLPERTQFLAYSSVYPEEWIPPEPPPSNPVPVVLHAPSNRSVKGTAIVLDAVDRLRNEGVPFEFRLVEKMTHAEARKLYASADLLVDQLLLGWYGALAVELMCLAKPVICYIRSGDLDRIPKAMRESLPIINATPQSFYDTLKDCLTNRRHELPEIGRRGRAFAERWHDPRTVARQTKAAYEEVLARRAAGRNPASLQQSR